MVVIVEEEISIVDCEVGSPGSFYLSGGSRGAVSKRSRHCDLSLQRACAVLALIEQGKHGLAVLGELVNSFNNGAVAL